MKLVLKYGGETLDDSKSISQIVENIIELNKNADIVVVCSALSGVTDNLVKISEHITNKDQVFIDDILSNIMSKHENIIHELIHTDSNKKLALNLLKVTLNELRDLTNGLLLLGESTPRSLDYLLSFGEKFSAYLFSTILLDHGIQAIGHTGKEIGIITDSNFSQARILKDTTKLHVTKAINKLFSNGTIPVVGGFSGADQYGHITTIGRGGSDYTATIIAHCIQADEVWLLTNVDGMMSADPEIVNNTTIIKNVSFVEAIEMALFGAKQIHPLAFEPILEQNISIRVRNAFKMNNEGTLISKSIHETENPAKCVYAIRHCCLIDIVGWGMTSEPGTAAKIFANLAQAGVNIMMISQNPSESSISIMIKEEDVSKATHSLETNLLGKMFKNLELTPDVAVVALIGSGMRGTTGIASRVFTSVAKNHINIIMITQGSSELNIAFAIKDKDHKIVLNALHEEFSLSKS